MIGKIHYKSIVTRSMSFLFLLFLLNTPDSIAQLNIQNYIEQGKRSLFRNENSDAIRKFNTVIKINPGLFQPYFFRGVAKFNLGDYVGARSDFSKAISLHPYFTHAFHYRGITQERLNNYNSALNDYNSALEIDPVNPDIYSSRGFTRMLMNDTIGSLRDYNEAIMLDPYNYGAYLNRSLVYSMMKDFEKALKDCSKAININKYNIEAFFRRGIIYYNKGDMVKALEDFNFMIRVDSTNSRAFYYRALAKYKQEDISGAMADYNKVIELDPLNALTYYNRAILKGQVGDEQGAIRDYDRVVELNPNNIFAFYNRGGVKLEVGDLIGARDDFSRVIELYPGFTQAYQNRAVVKNRMNDYVGAMKDQEMANRISNDKFLQNNMAQLDSTYFNKIIELKANFDNGNISSEGLASLNESVKMKPGYMISFVNKPNDTPTLIQELKKVNRASKGNYFLDLVPSGQTLSDEDLTFADAESEFNYKENSFLDFFLKGTIYGLSQDFNNAFEFLGKALKKDSDNYLVYFNMAALKYQLTEVLNAIDMKNDFLMVEDRKAELKKTSRNENAGAYQEIIRLYDRVLVLNPNFGLAYFNRAYIKSLNNDLPGAISDYRFAISLNPELAEAYFNRGLIHIYLDDMDHGCEDISKAGELGLKESYYVIKKYCQ